MTTAVDRVHHGQAARWGGWSWAKPTRGEHFRRCSYCGSIHPEDLAAETSWTAHWADMKYGWPHKFYVDIVNRNPERLYVLGTTNSEDNRYGWTPVGEMTDGQHAAFVADGYDNDRLANPTFVYFGARPVHNAKFYSAHLADPAIPDEVKDAIQQRSGLRFTFTDDGRVTWSAA